MMTRHKEERVGICRFGRGINHSCHGSIKLFRSWKERSIDPQNFVPRTSSRCVTITSISTCRSPILQLKHGSLSQLSTVKGSHPINALALLLPRDAMELFIVLARGPIVEPRHRLSLERSWPFPRSARHCLCPLIFLPFGLCGLLLFLGYPAVCPPNRDRTSNVPNCSFFQHRQISMEARHGWVIVALDDAGQCLLVLLFLQDLAGLLLLAATTTISATASRARNHCAVAAARSLHGAGTTRVKWASATRHYVLTDSMPSTRTARQPAKTTKRSKKGSDKSGQRFVPDVSPSQRSLLVCN